MSDRVDMEVSDDAQGAGLVPRLRFPEFRGYGGWGTLSLAELATITKEKAGNRKLVLMSVTAGVGLVSQLEKFGREIAGKQAKNYYVLRQHDFAYNKSATKEFPEGYVALYRDGQEAAVPNSIFTCFRADPSLVIPQFLGYLFESNLHGLWLRRFISVGARAHGSLNVSDDDLLATPVPLPIGVATLLEQQRIADCLSSLDDLIAVETRKLDALKTHKKGLMQRLFPREGETVPRLRFPEFNGFGPVRMLPLAEAADFVDERMYVKDLTPSQYVSTENLLPDFGSIVPALKLPPVASVIAFRPGDILISNIRPYLRKVWRANMAGGASNDIIIVRASERIREDYLSAVLRNDAFIGYVMGGAKGVKMPRGDIFMIEQYPIPCPTLAEQQRIADCLSSLDDLIVAETRKLDALKTHKKGLMKQLFPLPEASIT